MPMTEADQAVMQVTEIALGEVGPSGTSSNDRERRVEDGDAEDEEGDEQRGEPEEREARHVGERRDRLGPTADHHRRGRHHQTEEERATIAHEDLRRMEVVREKADAYAEGDRGDEGTDVVRAEIPEMHETKAVDAKRRR